MTNSVNCSQKLALVEAIVATIAIFSERIPESSFYLRIRCDQVYDVFHCNNNVGDSKRWKGECFLYSRDKRNCFALAASRCKYGSKHSSWGMLLVAQLLPKVIIWKSSSGCVRRCALEMCKSAVIVRKAVISTCDMGQTRGLSQNDGDVEGNRKDHIPLLSWAHKIDCP